VTVCGGALFDCNQHTVSLIDVRKEIAFCRELGIPIIGLLENMSGYKCKFCRECTNIFSRFVRAFNML
jgi:Mrp family chromosome partitioning ATPase